MKRNLSIFSKLLRQSCVVTAILIGSVVPTAASIDWGGGVTQFYGHDGTPLTADSGCAVLIAVSEGELIDFREYTPCRPEDLVTAGAVLQDGPNLNRVIATSCFFYSGYLLYSAIPDVSMAKLIDYGAREGDQLFLVVWDRRTFASGKPTDNSYYTVQPLFIEGVVDDPVYVSLNHDTAYAEVVYPARQQQVSQTSLAAHKAGHNTYGCFRSWLEARGIVASVADSEELRAMDYDNNGRSEFEEYALRSLPRMGRSDVENIISASAAASEVDEETGHMVPDFIVELRGSDPNLSYTASASVDLKEWQSAEIYYEQGVWYSRAPQLKITGRKYIGEGVWSVAMRYQSDVSSERCFYKLSVN